MMAPEEGSRKPAGNPLRGLKNESDQAGKATDNTGWSLIDW